jgi:hypothetical protein
MYLSLCALASVLRAAEAARAANPLSSEVLVSNIMMAATSEQKGPKSESVAKTADCWCQPCQAWPGPSLRLGVKLQRLHQHVNLFQQQNACRSSSC